MSRTKRQFAVTAAGTLQGRIRVPGDKSISHRAVMLGALAEGTTQVCGFLEGQDSLATLRAFRAMGVDIEGPSAGWLRIRGVGLHGLKPPVQALDLGNSGTSMRLMAGLLAGQRFSATLIGDASLSKRPMQRILAPLQAMGARIAATETDTAPLRISPTTELHGISYAMPIASAQVKSSVLLAGLYAEGQTCVAEPATTRDHTERMLSGLGYAVDRAYNRICLRGGGKLRAANIDIPADISSATFFIVGASIAPDSDVLLEHVGINPTRLGVVNILRAMGAKIDLLNQRDVSGEPVADIRVRTSRLSGIRIPEDQVPLAIDEFPAIFIAAACAQGETRLSGAAELRVKESDRIQAMAEGLTALGVVAQTTPDGMVIQGGKGFSGGYIDSRGDHRIAMAFAIAAVRATGPLTIDDCANVDTSFPGFAESASRLGLQVVVNG